MQNGQGKLKISKRYPSYQDAVGLDGEPIEFEWKILPRFTTLTILKEIQLDLERKNTEPDNFKDRLIFMSVFNDIVLSGKRRMRIASRTQRKSRITLFQLGHWTFLGPGPEKKWYGSSYDGQWDRTANKMVQQFKETGHPIFTATNALSLGMLKQRKGNVPFTSMEISWTQN